MRDPAAELVKLARQLARGYAVEAVKAAQAGEEPPGFEAGEEVLNLAVERLGAAADAWARLPAHHRAALRGK